MICIRLKRFRWHGLDSASTLHFQHHTGQQRLQSGQQQTRSRRVCRMNIERLSCGRDCHLAQTNRHGGQIWTGTVAAVGGANVCERGCAPTSPQRRDGIQRNPRRARPRRVPAQPAVGVGDCLGCTRIARASRTRRVGCSHSGRLKPEPHHSAAARARMMFGDANAGAQQPNQRETRKPRFVVGALLQHRVRARQTASFAIVLRSVLAVARRELCGRRYDVGHASKGGAGSGRVCRF